MAQDRYDVRQLSIEPRGWSKDVVDAVPGFSIPTTFEVLLSHPDWPTAITVYGGFSVDTGPVINGLRAMNPSVSAHAAEEVLAATVERGALMQLLAARAATAAIVTRLAEGLAGRIDEPGMADALRVFGDRFTDYVVPHTTPRRRRTVTREHLAEVAEVYREAVGRGEPPTMAVKERFTTSHSTAARWVGMAREQGELGAADTTRPGERDVPVAGAKKPRKGQR